MFEKIESLHYCKKCGQVCSNNDEYCDACIVDEIYDATHIYEEYEVIIIKRGE